MMGNLVSTLQKIWIKHDLVTRSNALAFGLLISFLPLLILTVITFTTLLPVLSPRLGVTEKDFLTILHTQLSHVLPIPSDDLANALKFFKEQWSKKSHKNILSISFLVIILYASQAMWLLLKNFEIQHLSPYNDLRPYIFRRVLSLYFTLFILIFAVAILLTVFGMNLLLPKTIVLFGLSISVYIKWFILGLLLYLSLCVIYKFGNLEKLPFFSLGAFFATISIGLISVALTPLLKKYSTYHLIYGPVTAILLVAVWFQISSFALFIGQDINIAIKMIRKSKASSQNMS